jgi:shikimate kinase
VPSSPNWTLNVIVLVGFMGAGKTTAGRLLAAKLGVPFTDSDHVIEARAGKPIPQIFADDGEAAFRQLEHEVIVDLLNGEDRVLALGCGAATHGGTRAVLAAVAVPVVYLRVSYAEAMSRVGSDRGRPMLARPDVAQLHKDRDPLYAQAATLTIGAGGRSPEEIALDILTRLDAVS